MKASSFLKTAAVLPEAGGLPSATSEFDQGSSRGSANPVSESTVVVRDVTPNEPDEASGDGGAVIVRDVTPAGTEIAYCADPRGYWVNGVSVPSVTTVLDVLKKGGLTTWGMRVGIQGVLSLFEQGDLTTTVDWENEHELIAVAQGEDAIPADLQSVEALMKERKLTTNDVKGSAADRGVIVHQALEDWAMTGIIPDPDDFDEREKGYVQGLMKFLIDADPTPLRQEVMVGSAEYGFAGRYDIELLFKEARHVRLTPKQKWHDVGPGNFLTDAKSSSGVYPSTHFRQLAGYEGARIENGYDPTDGQYILHVNGEGSYAFVPSNAVYDDFLAVLSVYKSDQRMKVKT